MTDITITGLHLRRRREINTDGSMTLAFFTAEVGEITVKGCGYLRRPNGMMTVLAPAITFGGERRAVLFSDALKRDLTIAARNAYRALGGTDDGFTEAQQASFAKRELRREVAEVAHLDIASGIHALTRSRP